VIVDAEMGTVCYRRFMNSQLRLLSGAAATVLLFDSTACLASKRFGLPYARFAIGSSIIYCGVGVLASRSNAENAARFAILAGAFTGLVDASAGWWLSSMIGPGRPPRALHFGSWLAVAFLVMLNAAFFAAAGYFMESRLLYKIWPPS